MYLLEPMYQRKLFHFYALYIEAKDMGRPALPQQNKSDARQIIGPKSFRRAFDHFGAANLKKKKEERERERQRQRQRQRVISFFLIRTLHLWISPCCTVVSQ